MCLILPDMFLVNLLNSIRLFFKQKNLKENLIHIVRKLLLPTIFEQHFCLKY